MPYVYLADGHHRSASSAALHKLSPNSKNSKMLTAYFPDDNIKIHSFHRVVQDLNGLSADILLEELRKYFKIKVTKTFVAPYTKHEMTMFLDGQWFQLIWRKEILKNFVGDSTQLDVDLLNDRVLKPILGIEDVSTDKRLKYIDDQQDISKLTEAVGTEGVCFCLFPIDLDDLKTVVDENGTLPPKSTFFEPRMKNGLLVYEI